MASTYRWISGREPFSPFIANVRRVISVRMRCGVDGEEEGFRAFVSSALSVADSHRRSTSRLRPVRFPLFGVQSIRRWRPRCVIPRASKSVDVAKTLLHLCHLRVWDECSIPVLRGCLGHEDAWKTTRHPLLRHVHQPMISIFKSRYRSCPGLRNVVSRDHVLDQGRVIMRILNWSRYEPAESE